MKSQLAISHLLRHFLLFAFTILFLLTLVRAGFSLWQFDHVEDVQTLIRAFVQGMRFDAATVGMLLMLPVVLVPLLAMFSATLPVARLISPLWLIICLLIVLLLELVTPYFIYSANARPDLNAMQVLVAEGGINADTSKQFIIPAALGVILLLMMLYAFWARMETSRFLRYPVRKLPAILLSVVGLVVCVVAIRSNYILTAPALRPDAALVSTDAVVNEITLNSTFKTVHNAYSGSEALQGLIKIPDVTALKDLIPQ